MLTLEEIREAADKMVIAKAPPPNAEAIEKVFPGVTSGERPIFFCYGTTIFNPSGADIPLQIIAHEAVHSLRQSDWGHLEDWWYHYLYEPQFRYEQELAAHKWEYQFFRMLNNRHFSRQYLTGIAERLAGPLYGNMTTRIKAKRLIAA